MGKKISVLEEYIGKQNARITALKEEIARMRADLANAQAEQPQSPILFTNPNRDVMKLTGQDPDKDIEWRR
jgi:uncharacterized small protein (DUF1192 family)